MPRSGGTGAYRLSDNDHGEPQGDCGVATLTGAPPPGPIPAMSGYTLTSNWTAASAIELNMGQTLYEVAIFTSPPASTGPSSKGMKMGNPVSWTLYNMVPNVSTVFWCDVTTYDVLTKTFGFDRSNGLGPYVS